MKDMESIIFTNLSKYKKLNEHKLCAITEKYDLRKIDMEIIVYLEKCGEFNTAKDIANTNMFTKGHISQSVKRLNEKGYVDIVQDEKDMRVQHLFLNEKVRVILDEMNIRRREIEECVFKGVTEDELTILKSVFEKMCTNIMSEMTK